MAVLKSDVKIKNKKAEYEFFLLDKWTAGIVLTGTEIKSVRAARVSIEEAYCMFLEDGLYLRNTYIAEYSFGTCYNHEPRRDRKLLLNKRELNKIRTRVKEKGLTLIPTLMFIDENGRAKLNIALAKGKKLYDKRDSIKERDLNRNLKREL